MSIHLGKNACPPDDRWTVHGTQIHSPKHHAMISQKRSTKVVIILNSYGTPPYRRCLGHDSRKVPRQLQASAGAIGSGELAM